MKFPDTPKDGYPIRQTIMQIINYLRSSRVVSINGQRGIESPNGTSFQIKVGGDGGTVSAGQTRYVPWKPVFTRTGTDPTYAYSCRFNLGTVNDVCAINWDTDHTLPTDNSVRFVMLEVTTTSGQVTSLEIILETTAPIVDTVLIDTPPPVWRILLGVVDKTSGMMLETTNLQAIAAEIYRESKVVVTPGGEPFSRYWRWQHSSV